MLPFSSEVRKRNANSQGSKDAITSTTESKSKTSFKLKSKLSSISKNLSTNILNPKIVGSPTNVSMGNNSFKSLNSKPKSSAWTLFHSTPKASGIPVNSGSQIESSYWSNSKELGKHYLTFYYKSICLKIT